jgi:creatinine amidohydrolase
MLLHLSTWQEIESYLKTSNGVIIPIGSTEQHGPTGLIGTDFICAEAIAHGISQDFSQNFSSHDSDKTDKINATDVLVSSTLTIGMAEHHTAFPGTISLKPSTLILLVKDYVNSLVRHGFKHFFFVNGHGGNIAILRAAFTEIYQEHPQVRCRVANWWMCGSVYRLAKQLYGDKEGSHATPSEVALTMYVYPHSLSRWSHGFRSQLGYCRSRAATVRTCG